MGRLGSTTSPRARQMRTSYWGSDASQSVDTVSDPNVHQLFHNPTAFVQLAGSTIMNFHSTFPTPPDTSWPNGSAETAWDYGTTRAFNISFPGCIEYYIDYQIPLGMLSAAGFGGGAITPNTPLRLAFATANSLNNPFQKDFIFNGAFTADPTQPFPGGDPVTLGGGTLQQPIVQSITAAGCGPAKLTAQVQDTTQVVGGNVVTTVSAVDFYSWFDANGNGLADDAGSAWIFAANGATVNNPIGRWTASWNTTGITQGQYLIGVQAVDTRSLNADNLGHRTFSYLSVAPGSPLPNEANYVNPTPVPAVVFATGFANICGVPPPSASKTVSPSFVTAGGTVDYTITITNPTSSSITVTQITDNLPSGFTFNSNQGGTLGVPTSSPSAGAAGPVTWTLASATVPASGSRTFIFRANAGATVGTFSNTASVTTSTGVLATDPVQVGVGAPRLTIAKAANVASANPGDTLTYTITYSNDSPVNVTGATITDTLATGLTFVSASNSGTYVGGTRTITWSVGAIASGVGPFSVSFTATIDTPYPTAAAIPFVNTATITANETTPASASTSTFINAPRPALVIQKSASTMLIDPAAVSPGNRATFTISYLNTGNATATAVTISDPIPSGWNFDSASGGGTLSTGTVTWTIGSVAANASGSVQLVMHPDNPYSSSNPVTNTATISSTQTSPLSDSVQVGVLQSGTLCSTYYFHNATTTVGFDGTQRTANSTAPGAGQTGTGVLVAVPASPASVEAVRFYQDPATASDVNFSGSLTTNFYIDRTSGPGITIQGIVDDYNPITGAATNIGSASTSFLGSKTGLFTFTVPVSGTLFKGHRLRWIFKVGSNNTQTPSVLFQFDGNVTNSQSSGSTFADSNAAFCVTPPANLVISKQVNNLSAVPGGSLQYTISFTNTGQTNATGATITDTLPAGTTFVSATLNGSAASPVGGVCSGSPQVRIFNVNSSDTGTSGQATGGQSGTLVINATVNQPLTAGIGTLVNSAALASTQTATVSDSATTTVLRPSVTISKSANKSLLIPGDVVTYTLTALNSGSAAATTVQIADTIPSAAYFAYVSGSIAGGDSRSAAGLPTLTWTVNSLAAGASTTVSFQMQVGTAGGGNAPPAGVTAVNNTATVSDAQTTGTRSSNTVTVSISTNPNLALGKVVTDINAGSLVPGDVLEYTLTATNSGSGTATSVQVLDAIPSNTTYAAGTLVLNSVAQTDVAADDAGTFDGGQNRVIFSIGSLAGGASSTMKFRVTVNVPLPNGSTTLINSASVSAANASTRAATAMIAASATPNLTINKSGPSTVPFPVSTLSAAAIATTVITVASVQFVSVGNIVSVGGTVATVTAINGSTITLSTAVTAPINTPVLATYEYLLFYTNTGTANATNASVSDTLQAGLTCVSATPGGVCGAPVTLNLGTVAAGASGTLRIRVLPTSTGTFANGAAINSTEMGPITSNAVVTKAGALALDKSTSTAVVNQSPTGTTATYTIMVTNQLAVAASGVTVTDLLSPGFSYLGPTFYGGSGGSGCTGPDPTVGNQQPIWTSCTVQANGTLTITFTAAISASVGPSTYQNGVAATASNANVLPFDELNTSADDVTVRVTTLNGTVFEDSNGGGTQDPGEAGISGVTVQLVDPSTGTVIATTTTDAGGHYRFDGAVPPGAYVVREIDPALYTSTTSNDVPTFLDGTTPSVVNFGDQVQGTVSGIVFNDANGNGLLDPGESALAGVLITLDGGPTTATTDSNGNYVFAGASAGTHTITEMDPSGYTSTTPNTVPVFVAGGGAATANFGDVQQGLVSGFVFSDVNANGVQDASEPGLAGVTVGLYDSNGILVTAVTTFGTGAYEFIGVTAGAYTVRETDPTGFTSTTANIVPVSVVAGGAATANFGDQIKGSIAGAVFEDLNGNGVQDPNETGLGGVSVTLSSGPTAITAGDGTYIFTGLNAGSDTVTETDPAGFSSTTPNAVPVTVVAGGAGSAQFGDQRQGTISGVAFNDLNGNFIQDPGELGIDGVVITLDGGV